MSRRTQNVLREGLSAKIYLLAFNGPISGYKIGHTIQNLKPRETPQTAKIYNWTTKMQKENMIKKIDKTEQEEEGYVSKVEGIFPQIKNFLAEKDIQISDIESHILLKYLDSVNFRTHVEESFFYQKSFFVNAVDAVKHITEVLGGLALREHVCRNEKKDEKNEKYREYQHRVTDFKSTREIDSYWTEHVTSKIDYKNIEVKRTLVTRLLEEEYFERTGEFIKNEHYEYFEKNRFIAKSGKKIKYWIGYPEYITFLPSSLIKKLYKASSTYDLFQKTDHKALFALLLAKPENTSSHDIWDTTEANYFSNFWQEPQDVIKLKNMDKTSLKRSLEEQEKQEKEQRRLKEEQRKQEEEQSGEQLRIIKLERHMKPIEKLKQGVYNERQ
jgi:hypothetical protein